MGVSQTCSHEFRNEDKVMQMLRIKDVIAKTKLSRTGVYRAMAHAGFPRPVQLSKQRVAWREEDIDRWLASREAA